MATENMKKDYEDEEIVEDFVSDDGVSKVQTVDLKKAPKRPADISPEPEEVDDIEDDVETPQGTAGKKAPSRMADVTEAIENLFDGQDLSEEFKEKTQTIFESALNSAIKEHTDFLNEEFETRLETIKEELQEEFENSLTEQVDIATQNLVEKLDAYLDYVAEQWMEENEVAVETGIKVHMAESLFSDLKTVFENYNIDVSEEKIDLVAELEEQVNNLSEKVNDMINENIELQKEKLVVERELRFKEISEDLTDTQVEKLRSLSEGINADSTTEYAKKLEVLKENFFSKKKVAAKRESDLEILEETFEPQKRTIIHDDSVRAYTDAINKMLKK